MKNSAAPREQRLHDTLKDQRSVVIITTLGGAFGVVLAWIILYWITCWLWLLAASSVHHESGPPAGLPSGMLTWSLYIAGAAIGVAALLPERHTPKDEKGAWELAADTVLMLPRATISVINNFSAWQMLSELELQLAVQLMSAMIPRAVPVSSLPTIIPDKKQRRKILTALQLARLVDWRRPEGVPSYGLSGKCRELMDWPLPKVL